MCSNELPPELPRSCQGQAWGREHLRLRQGFGTRVTGASLRRKNLRLCSEREVGVCRAKEGAGKGGEAVLAGEVHTGVEAVRGQMPLT